MGKHKLFPRISPKKTWEGFVGGLLLTMIVSWVDAIIFPEVAFKHWLVIGVITAIVGAFGDLVESMFKRSVGVKDSGKFLPSHGGFLDRFDGLSAGLFLLFPQFEVLMLIYLRYLEDTPGGTRFSGEALLFCGVNRSCCLSFPEVTLLFSTLSL